MTRENKKKENTKSQQRGEYKVVFKGRLEPDFDKEQVVANIAQLTRLPAEKINKKFFSGKAVIIRRAHDEAHAQKLQQLFTQAGLEVIILKDEVKAITRKSRRRKKKSTSAIVINRLKKRILGNLRLISALVLAALLIFLGMHFWNKYNLNVEVPDEIAAIESALANKPLLFLSHINLQRLISRQSYFVADADALPGSQMTLFKQLKNAGIDPKKSIKQLLTAVYADDEQLISQTVLLGHFSVAAVKKFFIKYYHGELLPDADFVRLRISQINENSCEQEHFMEISIEPERILMSTNGHLDELHRILNQPPGTVTDLSNWQQYRADKLASLVLFKPQQASLKKENSQTVRTGQAGVSRSALAIMMTQDLISKNEPLESLFAGVGLQLLPPSGLLDLTLNSHNQAWLDQTRDELQTQLESLQRKSAGLVNVQALLNQIAVQQNTQADLRKNSKGDVGQLSMTIALDSEFSATMDRSISELMELFFTMGFAAGESEVTAKQPQHEGAEQLDAAPLKYWAKYDQSKLKAFNDSLDQFFKPAWIDGPFAIAIDELLLETHQDGDQVILQLRAKAQNIDNIGNQQVLLRVTEVTDQHDNNLLDKMNCGQSGSVDSDFFSSQGGLKTAYPGGKEVQYTELEVQQKIKLKKGIKFSQVKLLSGEIELNLATQTQSKIFARTEKNTIVTEYGSRILFKPAAPDSLSYNISGSAEKVLLVRALNNKKQYLSRISRSSMGNLFAPGHSVTQQYQGKIAFIEVLYAAKLKKINYPFVISKFPPYPAEDQWNFALQPVKSSSVANWNEKYQQLQPLNFDQQSSWNGAIQASWHNGPLNLALYGLTTSKLWGTTGQLLIKTPVIDELRHNLSVLEIYLRYPQVAENGDMGHSHYELLKVKGYYMNGEFIPDRNKAYMDSQLSFTLPYKDAAVPLSEITGDIIIHLPIAKHGSAYTDMSIGAQWEDEGVRTKIVRLGSDTMEFAVLANRDRLLQITLMDSSKQRISTTDIRSGLQVQGLQSQTHGGNIVVNYHGIPVKAILTVSEGQQTKRYPFRLKLK